ncbi:hypothetical protein [Gordonia humi]|uniref:Uncharacterized protein n=1 Tax=Gordonia humi TaxID=686429 RepID=A0A840EZJ9_9ACTN|nr:hypothetical protein [Gordonia humi]MBB4135764.1 hypothetical protein [Gordonia humi]
MSDDVISTEELWLERARVAREVGVELGELARSLNTVVGTNYFGVGCEEGEDIFAKLTSLLRTGSADLKNLSSAAHVVAVSAINTGQSITSTDTAAAAVLE